MKRGAIITKPLTATVTEDQAGCRFDAAAAQLFPDFSRSRLQAWIESGALRLNDRAEVRAREAVTAGDVLSLSLPLERAAPALQPQKLPLEVVYKDRALAVIHKPAGLTVHPGAGQPDGTLQNALLHHFPQLAKVPRAGLVHRLDKDTTGLLVVALSEAAHTRLTAMMSAREVRREYDALVAGILPAGGTVDAAIGRSPHHRTRMAVLERAEQGRRAVTHYRVAEKFARHTLLAVTLETGRTHQIRVHLAHLRHPIVGDRDYGGGSQRSRGFPETLREQLHSFPRQALHARTLALDHPISGEPLSWTLPRPADFEALLRALRAHAQGT